MHIIFHIKKKVWIWPGNMSSWHFVYIDGKEKEYIEKHAIKHHMGMVRVQVQVNKTKWDTSLLPHKKENCYLLAFKKEIRKREEVQAGEYVSFSIKIPIQK